MNKDQDCDQESPEEEAIRERRLMVIQGLLAEMPAACAEPAAAIRDVMLYLLSEQGDLPAELDDAYQGLRAIVAQKQAEEDAEDGEAESLNLKQ